MEEEICKCGHHTKDHSYKPEPIKDTNLYCDLCDCENFNSEDLNTKES